MRRFLRLFPLALLRTLQGRLRRGPLLPTWSFGFEAIITFMRLDWRDLWREPASEIRQHTGSMALWPRDLRTVDRVDGRLGEVPCTWFTPRDAAPRQVLLYLHGGSFQFGSAKTHGPLIGRLAKTGRLRAVGIDYRLLPEHPAPAGLEDTVAAYRALLAQGHRPEQVAVAGDSAGGHLALQLCRYLASAEEPLPGAVVLFSPWLDLSSSSASMQRNAAYDYGTREMLLHQAQTYAAGRPLTDPEVSFAQAPIPRLPPTLLCVGTAELLLDEGEAWAARAQAAGAPVELERLLELPHNGQLFPDQNEEAHRAIDRAAAFLRSHLLASPQRGDTPGEQPGDRR